MEISRGLLATRANTSYEGVTFFELLGTWLSLYPLKALARDISPVVPSIRPGFSGATFWDGFSG